MANSRLKRLDDIIEKAKTTDVNALTELCHDF
jgi:hypothetical protein